MHLSGINVTWHPALITNALERCFWMFGEVLERSCGVGRPLYVCSVVSTKYASWQLEYIGRAVVVEFSRGS